MRMQQLVTINPFPVIREIQIQSAKTDSSQRIKLAQPILLIKFTHLTNPKATHQNHLKHYERTQEPNWNPNRRNRD